MVGSNLRIRLQNQALVRRPSSRRSTPFRRSLTEEFTGGNAWHCRREDPDAKLMAPLTRRVREMSASSKRRVKSSAVVGSGMRWAFQEGLQPRLNLSLGPLARRLGARKETAASPSSHTFGRLARFAGSSRQNRWLSRRNLNQERCCPERGRL